MKRIIFKNSEPSRVVIKFFLAGFAVVLVGLYVTRFFYTHAVVVLGGERFDARVADSDYRRTKGLSGSSGLAQNEAMLFLFPFEGQHQFWMKDMSYPIDIIWMRGGKIVDIAPRVPPGLGMADAELPLYTPRLPVGQVVEVRAGTVDRLGIKIGDPVKIETQ